MRGTCEPDTTCNCNAGYYCTDKNTSCEQANPSGNCVEAESQFRTVDIAGTTYYISNDKMSWWDAVSACEALGNKKLLSVYDLIGDWDGTGPNSLGDLTRTALGDALYEAGWRSSGYGGIWSSVLSDSCKAYSVCSEGSVYINDRDDNHNWYTSDKSYAVCR